MGMTVRTAQAIDLPSLKHLKIQFLAVDPEDNDNGEISELFNEVIRSRFQSEVPGRTYGWSTLHMFSSLSEQRGELIARNDASYDDPIQPVTHIILGSDHRQTNAQLEAWSEDEQQSYYKNIMSSKIIHLIVQPNAG